MRVLLTGGGTAGHINPALAIAETVKQYNPNAVIEFVGVKNGKEADLIPREGYRLHFVRSMGIRRSLSPQNIRAVWLALTSPKAPETQKILDDFHPDIVIGTGGYASWPLMKAAADRGIPTAIHESNAIPGMTVKVLQRYVDRVWLNFADSEKQLRYKKKLLCVGNPLRKGFASIDRAEARKALGLTQDQLFLLSFGGSLGAREVNRYVLALMQELAKKYPQLLHIHASGKRGYDETKAAFDASEAASCGNCRWMDYIYDMPLYMAAADIVISRAGAMTISELALQQKPAILIPSPNVADNHQYKNAKALADKNAAILVEEKDLPNGALVRATESLIGSMQKRREMGGAIAAFADPKANARIWEDIQTLLTRSK